LDEYLRACPELGVVDAAAPPGFRRVAAYPANDALNAAAVRNTRGCVLIHLIR
jgi:hypothetical protein